MYVLCTYTCAHIHMHTHKKQYGYKYIYIHGIYIYIRYDDMMWYSIYCPTFHPNNIHTYIDWHIFHCTCSVRCYG